jgi:hypothetical protein
VSAELVRCSSCLNSLVVNKVDGTCGEWLCDETDGQSHQQWGCVTPPLGSLHLAHPPGTAPTCSALLMLPKSHRSLTRFHLPCHMPAGCPAGQYAVNGSETCTDCPKGAW